MIKRKERNFLTVTDEFNPIRHLTVLHNGFNLAIMSS